MYTDITAFKAYVLSLLLYDKRGFYLYYVQGWKNPGFFLIKTRFFFPKIGIFAISKWLLRHSQPTNAYFLNPDFCENPGFFKNPGFFDFENTGFRKIKTPVFFY